MWFFEGLNNKIKEVVDEVVPAKTSVPFVPVAPVTPASKPVVSMDDFPPDMANIVESEEINIAIEKAFADVDK